MSSADSAPQGENEAVDRLKRTKQADEMFTRAEVLHQLLMEDFNFLEAARLYAGGYEPPALNYADIEDRKSFQDAAIAYPNGLIQYDHFTHRSPYRVFKNIKIDPDTRSLRFLTRRSAWPPLSIWAHWFLDTPLFAVIMVVIIVVNSITIAVDQELDQGDANKDMRETLEIFDFFFLCLFVAEIILKWIDDFGGFWSDGWNVFDCLITSMSLVAPLLDLAYPDTDEEEELEMLLNAVKYLRIVRIFRSLNVVTRIHKIQLIWGAVLKTFTAMIFITALMCIFFYIFSIIGINAFARFSKTHKPNLKYRFAFTTLPTTFVTLFQLFTLDHWYELLLETQEVMGNVYIPVIFILVWILLGSFIFRNIFVGVMVNNFQNIRSQMGATAILSQQIDEAAHYEAQLDIFKLDQLEMEHINSDDPLVDWEAEVFHNLEIVRALKSEMSPLMWPRDTMFQYYMLLEAYASNLDERKQTLTLLDKSLLRFLDS